MQTGTLRWMLASSWVWHLTRWDGLFLCGYLVTHLGAPPIINQLVGVGMFAPMLLGAAISNVIRTRVNPRKLVVRTEAALLPASIAMAALVRSGVVQSWMTFPFMLGYGFGGAVNMTAQRELLFSMAGPLRAERTLTIETAGVASAMMLGPLMGGISIKLFGLGGAFAVPAVLLTASLLGLRCATSGLARSGWPGVAGTTPANSARAAAPVGSPPEATAGGGGGGGGLRLLKVPTFVALLAVTVIANLCYFAFIPLVPVIAKNLGAGAALAGVIGSAAGAMSLVATIAFVARPVRRNGATYVGGVALCLCCLSLLAFAPTVALAVLVLGVAGVGQAMFGTMQSILPMTAVSPHQRSAALGVLSTTIGVALPTGMVLLGVSSSVLGARRAMLVSALVGIAALGTLVARNPGLLRGVSPDPAGGSSAARSTRSRSILPPASIPPMGLPVRAGREGDPVAAQPELR